MCACRDINAPGNFETAHSLRSFKCPVAQPLYASRVEPMVRRRMGCPGNDRKTAGAPRLVSVPVRQIQAGLAVTFKPSVGT